MRVRVADAYVLPGKHNIRAKYEYQSMYAFGDLWLVAEAGKTYTVKAESKGYSVHFWIEDTEGKVVGGIKGSDDEPTEHES
ncbi:MAG: hypothetical protein EOM20_11985 [Spartobacteria bacterium]|nr:hypothetical protein [Spartobacteria bacterium]